MIITCVVKNFYLKALLSTLMIDFTTLPYTSILEFPNLMYLKHELEVHL